ncbi:hypothetical protein ACROYT_G017105 [Oculina patagonica]
MAAIQRFIRSRKLQRLGKFILSVALLSCFIWHYVYNSSKQLSSGKIDVGNTSLQVAESTTTLPSKKPFVSALNVHIWRDLCGAEIPNLRKSLFFPRYPDKSIKSLITEFQFKDDTFDYGQLICGFVHPPSSSTYRFAIVSDDTSELWLSSNEDPNEKKMIARVFTEDATAWVRINQLHKYPDQISNDVKLRNDSKYYIEVLHKQGAGDGFVQVFWKSSQEKDFKLISAEYLSPYSNDVLVTSKNKDALHSVLSGRYRHELEQKTKIIPKEYLKFYSLPLIPKDRYLSSCDYKNSIVDGKVVADSLVYPEDDTTMGDPQGTYTGPNRVADKDIIQTVVEKITTSLRLKTSKKYFVKRIHKITLKSDPAHGDRYSVDLELGLNDSSQSFRLSEHVFHKKLSDHLCFPEGMDWNNNATMYFIVPVKDQGRWVYHFINELTVASLMTGDKNFHVIVVDFESQDIDMVKAFDTDLLRSRHTIIPLKGKFYKTLALNKAVERVPSEHDLLLLFDLHIDVPIDIMDSVRKNTIEGRLVYLPIVGRLDCDSTYVDHQGYWEIAGYGLLSVYKSDWMRFGGMNTEDYKYEWGGEDKDLLYRVLDAKLEVERIKHPGLYHHYQSKQGQWN